jgi:hypothetical protein
MTVPDLVQKLEASQFRTDVVARMVGYAVMIKLSGWENLKLKRAAFYALKKNFAALSIDPEALDL